MSEVKMMIVMRKDLNMRKGKMVAQGSHAALGLVLDVQKCWNDISQEWQPDNWGVLLNTWLQSSFKKICVSVKSEEQLKEVLAKAEAAGLPTKLITDAGHTEFNGVPTVTCGATMGTSEELAPITGELPLL